MKNNKKGAAQGGADNAYNAADAADQLIEGQEDEGTGAARGGKKGDVSDATKVKEKKVVAEATPDYEGSPRMGYTQNFGPARKSGYSKGAAKVNSIMGKGPAQEMSRADISNFSDFSKKAVAARKGKASSELKESAYLDSLNLAVNQGRGAKAKQLYGTEYKMYSHQTLSEAGQASAKAFQAKGEGHAQSVIDNIVTMSAAANTKKKKLNLPKA
tara:strand:+ start:99 stop:740 length:642 start_codon:yes stop_codon:yes gene_type:complete